jgi:hypothetical protein
VLRIEDGGAVPPVDGAQRAHEGRLRLVDTTGEPHR